MKTRKKTPVASSTLRYKNGESIVLHEEDAPELTAKKAARLRPFHKDMTEKMGAEWTAAFLQASKKGTLIAKPVGRPRKSAPKQPVKLRIDPDLLLALKASGKGWQTRINSLLRRAFEQGGF